jgi:hypothetical protein
VRSRWRDGGTSEGPYLEVYHDRYASPYNLSPIIANARSAGSCANPDWALYHDSNNPAARVLPTRANGLLTVASRR